MPKETKKNTNFIEKNLKEINNKKFDDKVIIITQVKSPIGREKSQRSTLIGLGLNKISRTKVLQDTLSVRGMIEKVKHLIKISL